MITPFIQAAHLLPMVNQEGGAMPGPGLSALQTFTYFVATPVLLFLIIGGLAWISSAPKKEKSKDSVAKSDEDNDDFITFIA
jgi:hypothetical protein